MLSEHTHIPSPCWLPNIQRNVPLYSLTASFTFLRLRMGTSKFSLKFPSNNNATTVNSKIILYSRSQIHGSILKDMAVKRLQTVTHASCLHHLLTPPSCPLLNSGQTSRLVSCGFTFGSQYTHLIHSQTFFVLLPPGTFSSPSLLEFSILCRK